MALHPELAFVNQAFWDEYRELAAQYTSLLNSENACVDKDTIVEQLSELICVGSPDGFLLPRVCDILSDQIISQVSLHQAQLFLDRYFKVSNIVNRDTFFWLTLKWIELHLSICKRPANAVNLWLTLISFENGAEFPKEKLNSYSANKLTFELDQKEYSPFGRLFSLSVFHKSQLGHVIRTGYIGSSIDIQTILKDMSRYHHLAMTENEFYRAMRDTYPDQPDERVFDVYLAFFQLPHYQLDEVQQIKFFKQVDAVVKKISRDSFTLDEVEEVIQYGLAYFYFDPSYRIHMLLVD